MITPRSMRTMRLDSRNTHSVWRGSRRWPSVMEIANGDASTSLILTTLPSTLEIIFWVTTKISPASIGVPWAWAASIIGPARLSPSLNSGIPSIPITRTSGGIASHLVQSEG